MANLEPDGTSVTTVANAELSTEDAKHEPPPSSSQTPRVSPRKGRNLPCGHPSETLGSCGYVKAQNSLQF